MFTVNLPLPPSANNAFVNVKGRGRVPSAEHKAWKALCSPMVLRQWREQGQPVIGKPYALYMAMDVNHQSDIVNREKLATDLIVKTIPGFPGDQWINQAIIIRDRSVEGMRIEIMSLPRHGGEARSIGELIEPIMADIVARQEAE